MVYEEDKSEDIDIDAVIDITDDNKPLAIE